MTLTEILRTHNPDTHPDCHAAADEIESLQSRLDEANARTTEIAIEMEAQTAYIELLKQDREKAEASNKVLREALKEIANTIDRLKLNQWVQWIVDIARKALTNTEQGKS